MRIRVLLADDHTIVREGLRFLLEAQAEIKVVGLAANGRQAVRQAERLFPDVVIMDIAMPELNGIEATYQIKEIWTSIQVIILSMQSAIEQVCRALRAGANGYLLKETAGLEVAAAVRAVQSGQQYLSAEISERLLDDYVQLCESNAAHCPLNRLNAREREILQLVAEGKSNASIAETLYLSCRSVETYRRRLMRKLEINNVPNLVKFALRHGVTYLE